MCQHKKVRLIHSSLKRNRTVDCLIAFSLFRNFKLARSSKISDRFLSYPVALCGVAYFVVYCTAIWLRFNERFYDSANGALLGRKDCLCLA